MGKRIDIIYDLVFFFIKMKEKDKTSFRRFLSNDREGDALIRMLRALDKCDPHKEPMGLVKRLVILSGGRDYRLFLKFKSILFEFEITSKRAHYFKYQDNHYYLLIELKKEFLAAQMMTERDAYITSIHSMIETHKRAQKFEFIQMQKDCADNLNSYYHLTGNHVQAEFWHDESRKLSQDLIRYNSIHHIFEKKLNSLNCCNQHVKLNSNEVFESSQSKIRKINWMMEILKLNERNPKTSANDLFKQSHKLFREFLFNPGLYPKHFKAAITKYVLEDLYKMGKIKLLSRFASSIYVLDVFPVYRRIPLIHFFLFFLLKSRNFRILDLVFDDINTESSYLQFQPFIEHKNKIEILYLLLKNKPKEALRLINRNCSNSIKCVFSDFDIRLSELICLYKCKNMDIIFDKLESMRRFTFRNKELSGSNYNVEMYRNIRSIILHQKIKGNFISLQNDNSVYDLRILFTSIVKSLIETKIYIIQDSPLLNAAETTLPPFKAIGE